MAKCVSQVTAIQRWWLPTAMGVSLAVIWLCSWVLPTRSLDRLVDRLASLAGKYGYRIVIE